MQEFRFIVVLVQLSLEKSHQASRLFSLKESSSSLQALESFTNIHEKF